MSEMMIGGYEVRDEELFDYVKAVNSLNTDENYLLQAIPLDEVANQLGYTGSLERFEFPEKLKKRSVSLSNDAIKLVCLYKDYNPSEAKCFLLSKMEKQFSFLRDEHKFVYDKAKEQMNILGGDRGTRFKIYRRITVDDSTPKASRDDLSRGFAIKEICPQYSLDYDFSADEVAVRISRMFTYNKLGESIVIKPISERYRFIVLRNMSEANYDRLVRQKYNPVLSIKESWDCYSSVFVLPAFYDEDVSDAVSTALAAEFEAILDDCIYVEGTSNYSLDTERRGKFPVVELTSEHHTEFSEVLRNFIMRTLRQRFESIQEIRENLFSTTGKKTDKDLGVKLFSNGFQDGYYSHDEVRALLVGNGEHADGSSFDRRHFSDHVFKHIDQTCPKKYKPIIDIPFFSEPLSIITFDDEDEEEVVVEEPVQESHEEPEPEATEPKEEEKSPTSFWGKLFK